VPVLYVLRHAKSSWNDPGLPDRARPLAPRGERAAAVLGAYLAQEQVRPDRVLCSPVRRAVDTLAGVRVHWKGAPDPILEEGLYGASARELAERLRRIPGEVASVLLVGHNPGLHDLVRTLAGSGPPEELGRLRQKLPTAGWVELALPGPGWRDLAPERGELRRFRVPRDLV